MLEIVGVKGEQSLNKLQVVISKRDEAKSLHVSVDDHPELTRLVANLFRRVKVDFLLSSDEKESWHWGVSVNRFLLSNFKVVPVVREQQFY